MVRSRSRAWNDFWWVGRTKLSFVNLVTVNTTFPKNFVVETRSLPPGYLSCGLTMTRQTNSHCSSISFSDLLNTADGKKNGKCTVAPCDCGFETDQFDLDKWLNIVISSSYGLLFLVASSVLLLVVSKSLHIRVVAGYHHYLSWAVFFLSLPDFRYNQVLTVYYGVFFSYLLSSWKLSIPESCSNAQC